MRIFGGLKRFKRFIKSGLLLSIVNSIIIKELYFIWWVYYLINEGELAAWWQQCFGTNMDCEVNGKNLFGHNKC
jgi:hypothetical protein